MSTLRCDHVMTRNPRACLPGDTLLDAIQLMKELNIGFVPVVAAEGTRRLVGVLTDRDAVIALVNDARPGSVRLSEVMRREPVRVQPSEDLFRCAELMERYQVRRLPVVDQNGELVGVLTTADIINAGQKRRDVEAEVPILMQAIVAPCAGAERTLPLS